MFRIKCVRLDGDPLRDDIVTYFVGLTLGYNKKGKRNKVDFSIDANDAFLMNQKDSRIFLRLLKKYIREYHCIFERERIDATGKAFSFGKEHLTGE